MANNIVSVQKVSFTFFICSKKEKSGDWQLRFYTSLACLSIIGENVSFLSLLKRRVSIE